MALYIHCMYHRFECIVVVYVALKMLTILLWFCCYHQRWSRGHKKNPRPRPRTAFPRTDTLEAMDRNARGQGPRTQAQVLSKKKKKGLHKNFASDLPPQKKKIFTKIFQAISTKKRFPKNFQALHKILTVQKIVLSSSRGPANFRGLEAKDLTFEAKAKDFKICPRGRPGGQGRPRGLHLWLPRFAIIILV